MPWKLTYNMLKAAKRGMIVYAYRSGTSREDIVAKEDLERRKKARVEEDTQLTTRNVSTVLLTDIKTEKRIGMQVFYSTDEKGTKKQYAGVVVGESNNRYHIVWEDGLEGDVVGSKLIVADDRLTHSFTSPRPRCRTRGDVTKLATGTVTLADLTEERLLGDLHNVVTSMPRGTGAALVPGFIEAKDGVPYFVVDPNESIRSRLRTAIASSCAWALTEAPTVGLILSARENNLEGYQDERLERKGCFCRE